MRGDTGHKCRRRTEGRERRSELAGLVIQDKYHEDPSVLLTAFAAVVLSAQNQPVLGEKTVKVSDNVWAIMGFPNIAIIVGNRATLVVDTGLGPANGATIARVAARLAPGNQKIFLTTTHFHPEHAAGEAGFPRGTILIRNSVQQHEMELHGKEMVDMFASRSRETEGVT